MQLSETVNYKNRGGEWRGCIAATPYCYMVRLSVKASISGANKQPVNLSLSNRLDFAGDSVNAVSSNNYVEVCLWHLKSSVRTVVVLTCIKLGFMPVLELPTQITVPNTNKPVSHHFQKDYRNFLLGLLNILARMFAWNLRVNTGFLYSISLRKPVGLHLLIQNTRNLRRVTKQIVRMQSGSVIYLCVT